MYCTLIHLRPIIGVEHSHVLKSRSPRASAWASRGKIHVHNHMPPRTYSARLFSCHPHICTGHALVHTGWHDQTCLGYGV